MDNNYTEALIQDGALVAPADATVLISANSGITEIAFTIS